MIGWPEPSGHSQADAAERQRRQERGGAARVSVRYPSLALEANAILGQRRVRWPVGPGGRTVPVAGMLESRDAPEARGKDKKKEKEAP